MSILKKIQLQEGDTATLNNDSTRASLEWFVEFSEPKASALHAISAGGFIIGQAHPQFNALSLEDISAESHDSHKWNFSASYSLEASTDNSDGQAQNARSAISYGSWHFQKVAAVLLNTVGDPFDPPPIVDVFFPSITVSKTEKSPNISHLLSQGYFNSEPFSLIGITVPAFCAQFSNYSISEIVDIDESGREWVTYKNSYTIKLNFSKSEDGTGTIIGFQSEYLNAGYNKLVNGESKKLINSVGEEFDTPQMLSVDGQSTVGKAGKNFILYTPEELIDFSDLGLPTVFPRQKQ